MALVKLNLGRNCLKYIIKLYGVKEIFIPYYTCPVVWQVLRTENCRVKFYHIQADFLPDRDFPPDSFILYTNYFGLCYEICEKLSERYPHLIVDNSQGFYAKPAGMASFNSLRKFFSVPNGAMLTVSDTLLQDFKVDNVQLNPVLFHENYETFVQNELALNKETEIKLLNPVIEKQINGIDFEKDKQQRIFLYNKYAKIFDNENYLKFKPDKNNIPYCYPFCAKNSDFLHPLMENKITLLKLWSTIPKDFREYSFLNNTIAMPLNDLTYAEKILQIYTQKNVG